MSDDQSGIKIAIRKELGRIEEDCDHSGKSHFNAALRWSGWNFRLGLASTVLSAVAGATYMKSQPEIAAAISITVAIMAGLITFLKPSERAAMHKSSGDQYLALKNEARVFREIKLNHLCDDAGAACYLDELTGRRSELNGAAPQFSEADRKLARAGIEQGESKHIVDKET